MSVDRNENIWAWANTGSKIHAFVQMVDGSVNHKRAMCRKTITRNSDTQFQGQNELKYASQVCTRCVTLANEMWDRAEASMQPSSDYHAEGWVEPVAERGTPIPADMNRELLRQAKAVAEAHKMLFPAPVIREDNMLHLVSHSRMDALHAEALAMDAEETAKAEAHLRGWTRFHYTATKMRARFDMNLRPANYRVGVVSGYVFAGRESDALDRVHDTVAGERFMYLTDIFLTPTR